MPEKIQSVEEYFDSIFEDIPRSAHIIVVVDPQRFLSRKFDEEYIDSTGKKWKIYHYYENDFVFRQEYSKITKDIIFPHIIWITFPEVRRKNKINISYINDIISKVEISIDLGLVSILKKIIPLETWFRYDELSDYSKDISDNLEKFIELHKDLRKEILSTSPLNIGHIKAIVLVIRNPNIIMKDLIFRDIDETKALIRYMKIGLNHNLGQDNIKLLKEVIKSEPQINIGKILAWIDEDIIDIAIFLYLMDIFKRYNMVNPIIQLKGLGLLGFDPEKFDHKQIETVLILIEKEKNLLNKIAEIVENRIFIKDIYRFIYCIPFKSQRDICEAIMTENSPILVFGLSINLLKKIVEQKHPSFENIEWTNNTISHPILKNKIQTEFSFKAMYLLSFFSEINFIHDTIRKEFYPKTDLADLIDWYKESKACSLELIFARANMRIKVIEDQMLKKSMGEYLYDLGEKVRKYIQLADSNLSFLIESNIKDYFSHPRLIINVLKDNIIDERFQFRDERRIWILIFDGMRIDTWENIVKPIISDKFEIEHEKLYISILPSSTDIARTSLLSGCLPSNWKDYDDKHTTDENILASRLLGLSKSERRDKLCMTIKSETDFAQKRLDESTSLYNILIYNLSDDRIHSRTEDVNELNLELEQIIRKNVLPDIETRIRENDLILITSDHGFIELSKKEEVKVYSNNENEKISYRYLSNIDYESGLKIQYGNRFFTVSKGRKWFGRESGKFTRYSHGGISLDELVIPAIKLKKIIMPVIKFNIEYPQNIVAAEDVELILEFIVKNIGNKRGEFILDVQTNIGQEKIFRECVPSKGKSVCKFSLMPSLELKNISYKLSYFNSDKKEIKESRNLSTIVNSRKDKVKLSLGALDKLGS